jgi:hypothetical protein
MQPKGRAVAFAASLLILAMALMAAPTGAQPSRCETVGPARFYWHYDCVKAEFERIQSTYPKIAKFYEIGKSSEDRPIWVLEIANFEKQTANPRREGFYLDATHHGNEIQGTEAAMRLARKIVSEYGTNATVTRWVDEFNIYINPVINPDGNIRDQRHNARGVDLNRNYPFEWGVRASNYGPSPASEPETQANVAFMKSKSLDVYASLHTGTWDYVAPRCNKDVNRERALTDDEALYERAQADLVAVSGMGFRGASGTGESICWAYDILEVFSILPEVATEQNQLFTASETTQLNRAMLGLYYMVENTGRFGAVLEMSLVANASTPSGLGVRINNTGLMRTINWTLEMQRQGSSGAPILRGGQEIASEGSLLIPVPAQFFGGNVTTKLLYEHLNVNPRVSDPQNGTPSDPRIVWLNFTKEQQKQVLDEANLTPPAEGTPAPSLILVLVALGLAFVAARRR